MSLIENLKTIYLEILTLFLTIVSLYFKIVRKSQNCKMLTRK